MKVETTETPNTANEDQRGKFSNKFEYFLTALSYAVGLGNVWRSALFTIFVCN